MDNRAGAPVVGKILAAGIAVLYIAGTTGILLGGVVPEYRTAAGEELSERVLAEASATVERAVPDSNATVDVALRVDLPSTIRNDAYTLVLENRTLAVDHPNDALDTRTNLSIPSRVTVADNEWQSNGTLVVRVVDRGPDRIVKLGGRT